MPIYQGYTTKNGERKGYYQFGQEGERFLYSPGNEQSRKAAKTKAENQRQAAYASGYEG